MKNKNALGYLRLAMLRNEKLSSMQFTGLEEDSLACCAENAELVRIEEGLVRGLEGIKEEGRSSLYSGIVEARRNAIIDIYKLTHMGAPAVHYMKALSESTKIKEAADYVEVLLQLHYPKEFPNELATIVLDKVNIAEGVTHRENFGLETPKSVKYNTKNLRQDDLPPETVKSNPATLFTTEILDKLDSQDSAVDIFDEGRTSDFETEEGMLISPFAKYKPKIISLYKSYQQQRQSSFQEGQQELSDTAEYGLEQDINPNIEQNIKPKLEEEINPNLDDGPVQ